MVRAPPGPLPLFGAPLPADLAGVGVAPPGLPVGRCAVGDAEAVREGLGDGVAVAGGLAAERVGEGAPLRPAAVRTLSDPPGEEGEEIR
jgi:hypothetical protein